MNRDFKGVWIPKEIWLNKELSLQDKCFIVEINSLDNDEGCYATNAYFAEFFGLSAKRVSEIINSLVKRGFLTSTILYKEGTREVDKRVLHVVGLGYPESRSKSIPEVEESGIPEVGERSIPETVKDNNIYNNNTKNNINNIYSDFNKIIIAKYPGKKTKAIRDKKVPSLLKKYSIEELTRCIERYARDCRFKEKKYILNEGTFWNGRYEDYLDCNYEDEIGAGYGSVTEANTTSTVTTENVCNITSHDDFF